MKVIPNAASDSEDSGTFTFNDVTIDFGALPDLTDRALPRFNQATYKKGIFNNGCTRVNRIKEFCYIFRRGMDDSIVDMAGAEAEKRGWKRSGGWETRLGFTSSANLWNRLFPGDAIIW